MPEGTASKARFATGDRDWVRALTDAQAALAAEGVHLNDQGEVAPDPPQAAWAWEDDSVEAPQVQRALTKALDQKRRAQLLPRLPPEDRAWVRSCGGPGAGAGLNTAPSSEAERFHDASTTRFHDCDDDDDFEGSETGVSSVAQLFSENRTWATTEM